VILTDDSAMALNLQYALITETYVITYDRFGLRSVPEAGE